MKPTAPTEEGAVFETIGQLAKMPDDDLVATMRSWHFSYERAVTQRNRLSRFCLLMCVADGAALAEAKRRHRGKFGSWQEKNCPFKPAAANYRMNFYNFLISDPDGLEAAWKKLPGDATVRSVRAVVTKKRKNPARPPEPVPATPAFKKTAAIFEALRKAAAPEIPAPVVRPNLPTDPCDFTSATEVRLNVAAVPPDVTPEWHAAHVLGHWLACVHEEGDRPPGDDRPDLVADTIAVLVLSFPRAVVALSKLPK